MFKSKVVLYEGLAIPDPRSETGELLLNTNFAVGVFNTAESYIKAVEAVKQKAIKLMVLYGDNAIEVFENDMYVGYLDSSSISIPEFKVYDYVVITGEVYYVSEEKQKLCEDKTSFFTCHGVEHEDTIKFSHNVINSETNKHLAGIETIHIRSINGPFNFYQITNVENDPLCRTINNFNPIDLDQYPVFDAEDKITGRIFVDKEKEIGYFLPTTTIGYKRSSKDGYFSVKVYETHGEIL